MDYALKNNAMTQAPATVSANMRPLAMAGDDAGIVRDLRGNAETRHHLESLGFVQGASVRVVSSMGGNLIVDVKGSRIGIGKALAMKIWVE